MLGDTEILQAELKSVQLVFKALLNRVTAVEAQLEVLEGEVNKLKNPKAK
jgi:hypothetical protein